MASTITRFSLTDDSGTPASPVGDGTILNNAFLQDIFDAIDEMFAGAGAYATFSLGGILSVAGFGTSVIQAGGTGANAFRVRNTTAGAGNYAQIEAMADGASKSLIMGQVSSTFTSAGDIVQDGGFIRGSGPGGISLSASHASGALRFYSGSSVERMRIYASGGISLLGTNDPGNFTVEFVNEGVAISRSGGTGVTAVDVVTAAFGTGSVAGPHLDIGRNSSGNGAAGTLRFRTKSGTLYYVWVDDTGDLRISSGGGPTEDGATSDTSGTVVGTQT
jgi:hypothetical protein